MKQSFILAILILLGGSLLGQVSDTTVVRLKAAKKKLAKGVVKYAPIEKGTYRIQSAIVSKFLDVKDLRDANGTILQLWDQNTFDAQLFTIEPSNEANYYYIKTKWGRVLDIANASRAPQATLQTWDLHGGDNQKWCFIDAGDGYYTIQSKVGTCIEVSRGSSVSGTPIWMAYYAKENNVAQRWKLNVVPASSFGLHVNDVIYAQFERLKQWPYEPEPGQPNISDKQGANVKENVGEQTVEENNGMVCTSQKIKFAESNFERIIAGGIEEKIYPGAFYRARGVVEGSWNTYSAARNAMKIGLVETVGNGGSLETIVEPMDGKIDRSHVNNGMQTLLRNNPNLANAGANVFTQMEMHSQEQLKIFIGGDFSGWGATVAATFDMNKRREQNIVICKVTQKYLTIDVPMSNPTALLQNPTEKIPEDVVYVSSVSYGRIGYLSVKSTMSAQDIRVAVNAIYNNPSMRVGIKGDVNISEFLRTSEVNGFVYGGDPITVTDINDFFSYIRKGDIRNPALPIKPIFYKTKFLKTGKSAFVSMATEYTEMKCEPFQYLDLTLKGVSMVGHHNNDCRRSWGTVDVEVWETKDGSLEKRILPITENGIVQNVTQMMDWPNTGQVRPIAEYNHGNPNGYKVIDNVNKTWSFKINPKKIAKNEAVFIVKTYLGSQHKGCDICGHNPHAGMEGVETQRFKVQDVLNAKESENRAERKFEIKDGPMIGGPFTSPSQTDHQFRAHFDVSTH